MRVIIISFDALEYDLVKHYSCNTLMQKEYGKINLDPYLDNRPRGRGGGEPLTGEVYPIFITGTLVGPDRIHPKDWHELKAGFYRDYPTIFTFASLNEYGYSTALHMDVPGLERYSTWMDRATGLALFQRYFSGIIPLERTETEYYKYMDIKASYAGLINKLGYDLVMFYFKAPDKLQHIWKFRGNENKYRQLYRKCETIADHIIEVFSDEETLFIIFSDHGVNLRGGHSHYGFWSSNKPLGRGDIINHERIINLEHWHGIIKEWYEK